MARKQSSSRLSTIAARVMARVQASRRSFKAMGLKPPRMVNVRTTNLVALCMSVLSQEEARGQKRRKK